MALIAVPTDYRYVLAGVATIPLVGLFHSITVGSARKKSKVELPKLFASEAEAAADPLKHRFNCAQKSHMNFTENVPSVIVATLISGLQYPRLAAGLVTVWSLFRVVYHLSYSTGNPSKRTRGGLATIAQLVLSLVAFVSAVNSAISY
ncbi:membrane-associated proteins in eicosanoid and glutathione metabolism [Nadsonia fulvescens var. elongata DSM 6958]|uniref:Membrane-associated proteins in eicosanoid and glutathione metabolism n=1 Tax=Nadsonia fulvescens var. elongata DSM 6958 TaxID=857566 RepID=A0A1E3PSN4_9ASCO|nr:membrane-associated proteins in eicosanoid and glutathione metabolism [Nadsonia fulvescens var. elongata DSM 6958]